jgi:hypothetical protein
VFTWAPVRIHTATYLLFSECLLFQPFLIPTAWVYCWNIIGHFTSLFHKTILQACSFFWQIFGGIVYAGNPKLEETDLFGNEYPFFLPCYPPKSLHFVMALLKLKFVSLDIFSYLLFNFNDYPSGMVTLFNLLVMGNWQVWMEVRLSLAPLTCNLLYVLPCLLFFSFTCFYEFMLIRADTCGFHF